MEKEIKATRFEIEQQLNPVVGLINPFGLDKNDKFALFDLKIELSKIMDNIYDFRERTANRIDKPDNFEDIRKQAHSSDATEEVKEEWKKMLQDYNEKFASAAVDFYNTIESIPFGFISKVSFQKLMERNDFKLGEYEYIYNKLVKK